MSDSDDELAQERECLESIYADKYQYDESKNIFSVVLQAEEDDDDRETRQKTEFGVGCLPNFGLSITFKQPPNYPDVPIEYSLDHVENIVDEDEEEEKDAHITKEKMPDPFWFDDFHKTIKETCEENLGCIMAFTVCSDLQEQLTELCEQLHNERQERIAQLRQEAEDAHTKKLVGTPVTLETFTEWKIKFQAEMRALMSAEQTKFELEMLGRPTGKNIFLNKLGKLEEDGLDVGEFIDEHEKVEVDENLFDEADLEDLDGLEDELAELDAELEAES